MCGIVGCLGDPIADSFSVDRIADMSEAMRHRGPDSRRNWVNQRDRIFLGHSRLKIIDMSAEADQPMTSPGEEHVLVFNGEIYNHRSLRAELESQGYLFRTDHSDSEVVLVGYSAWGLIELLDRLDGDFAFGIWDSNLKRLSLARDRAGVKPLYFGKFSSGFMFGSEIKALLRDPSVPRRPSPAAICHYLTFLTTPAPLTMFEGVYKLPAAHWITVESDLSMAAGRYWSPTAPGSSAPELQDESWDTRVGTVRDLLEQSVTRRLESDVPTGVFLSGGVDSTAITALASTGSDKPVNTFTVGFDQDTALNEFHEAREIAAHYGTNHAEVIIGEAEMRMYLEELIYHQDEPLADWVCIPLHFVSELAKASGVRVVQVGEGADEQFAGYRSYSDYLRMYDRFWTPYKKVVPSPLQRGAASLARRAGRVFPQYAHYLDIVDRVGRNRAHFWSGAISFWDPVKARVMTSDLIDAISVDRVPVDLGLASESYFASDSFPVIQGFRDDLEEIEPDHDVLQEMVYSEFRLRLPELLLMRVDKITMESSVEARVPFLDKSLIEYVSGISRDDKLKNGIPKALLKQAVRGLIPDSVIDQPKKGFGAPMSDWLRGSFGLEARDVILSSPLVQMNWLDGDFIESLIDRHLKGEDDFALQIWTLYNLASWYRQWITSV